VPSSEQPEIKVFQSSVSRIWNGEDGIGRAVFFDYCEITLEDAKQHLAACSKAGQDVGKTKMPVVADISGVRRASVAARRYLAGDEAAAITEVLGLYGLAPFARILATFFLGMSRPPFPTKVFDNEEQALDWVQGVLGESDRDC
jgi:hypothetical protein